MRYAQTYSHGQFAFIQIGLYRVWKLTFLNTNNNNNNKNNEMKQRKFLLLNISLISKSTIIPFPNIFLVIVDAWIPIFASVIDGWQLTAIIGR